ncbi:hypothetical protein Cme02nite_48500 [Catellatospora methionotrophica]|uniref:Uncharacterized protein n=1 Tax=Catellatospora methionotrophica TaxID=121620 RepID=A0A8J3PHK6_9ACTN|nr:hypothetical protein Cme02nite_48500 [Catellatospora methionotrophica]
MRGGDPAAGSVVGYEVPCSPRMRGIPDLQTHVRFGPRFPAYVRWFLQLNSVPW